MTKLPLEVAELLREHAINGQVLESLTEEDLVSVGVDKFGWRRQLLLSRRELFEQLEFEDAISQEDGTEIFDMHDPVAEFEGIPTDFSLKGAPPPLCSGSGGLINLGPAKVKPQAPSVGLSGTGSPTKSSVSSQDTESIELALVKEIRSRLEQKAVDAHVVDAHVRVATAEISVPVESAGVAYRVDNSRLRSSLDGLEFHRSMSLSDTSDTHGKAVAPWGTIVYGTPFGSDWVKVGNFFLPTRVNGIPVLQRLLRKPEFSAGTSESAVMPSTVVRRSLRGVAAPTSMGWHYSQQKATPKSVTLSPTLTPRATQVVQDMTALPPGSWTFTASPQRLTMGTLGAMGVPGVQHSAPYDAV